MKQIIFKTKTKYCAEFEVLTAVVSYLLGYNSSSKDCILHMASIELDKSQVPRLKSFGI
jgi:hypothetical protein